MKQKITGSDIVYLDSLVDDLDKSKDVHDRDILLEATMAYNENGFDVMHYKLLVAQYDTNENHQMILCEYRPHPTVEDMLTGDELGTARLPSSVDAHYQGEPTGVVGLKDVYMNPTEDSDDGY